eukprot:TRINITY_DN876_c1_g1_i16.p1 TRINITY_DN876_c1_g1~~TRINITY_DN876_c1_g1_i16.p1  ORF type:complete len:536 (-),score=64.18 TRINITY_DN876_c1_g1_i16:2575-4182(-)
MFFNRCWGMLELLPQPVAWKPFYENSVVAAAYSTDRGLTVAEDGHDGRIFVTSGAAPVHTLYSYVPYFKPTHRLSISADGLYVAVVCDVDDDPHMRDQATRSVVHVWSVMGSDLYFKVSQSGASDVFFCDNEDDLHEVGRRDFVLGPDVLPWRIVTSLHHPATINARAIGSHVTFFHPPFDFDAQSTVTFVRGVADVCCVGKEDSVILLRSSAETRTWEQIAFVRGRFISANFSLERNSLILISAERQLFIIHDFDVNWTKEDDAMKARGLERCGPSRERLADVVPQQQMSPDRGHLSDIEFLGQLPDILRLKSVCLISGESISTFISGEQYHFGWPCADEYPTRYFVYHAGKKRFANAVVPTAYDALDADSMQVAATAIDLEKDQYPVLNDVHDWTVGLVPHDAKPPPREPNEVGVLLYCSSERIGRLTVLYPNPKFKTLSGHFVAESLQMHAGDNGSDVSDEQSHGRVQPGTELRVNGVKSTMGMVLQRGSDYVLLQAGHTLAHNHSATDECGRHVGVVDDVDVTPWEDHQKL